MGSLHRPSKQLFWLKHWCIWEQTFVGYLVIFFQHKITQPLQQLLALGITGTPAAGWKGETLPSIMCTLQALVWPDASGPTYRDGGDATL